MSFTKVLLFSKGEDVKTKTVYHGVGFSAIHGYEICCFRLFRSAGMQHFFSR